MVNGFFDVENRLDYLTANGDILPTLKNLIPWEDFRSELEVIYDHERKSNAGRQPFDVVMMFMTAGFSRIFWTKPTPAGMFTPTARTVRRNAKPS